MMKRVLSVAVVFLGGTLFAAAPAPAAETAVELLQSKCAVCHARTDQGLFRISESRRTPEGWDMTIARMMIIHGVKLTGDERAILVKYLADTRGLAPEETAGRRYALERTPGVIEQPDDDQLVVMCARCHTTARHALQRRTEADWLRLSNFHLGQFPTIEYQALGRDRNWWDIASTEVPKTLAKLYPLETDAWAKWQTAAKPELAGAWRVAGHQPGKGDYEGVLSATAEGDDHYSAELHLNYADGSTVSGKGEAIVYTGYEWRATLTLDGKTVHLVMAANADGSLSGRWFYVDDDAIGGTLRGVRDDHGPQIVAVTPAYLRAGETAEIAIHGIDLGGDIDLGDGVKVLETVSNDNATVVVKASAAADAAAGARDVSAGKAKSAGGLVVYQQIDSVRVEPAFNIARVGDNDGPLAPVPAQFDAVAYANGADGKAGTDDDLRIGVMPARWAAVNADAQSAALKDAKFAGSMDAQTGLFMPAGAGPNPARPFSTNNAGALTINATVQDGDNEVQGSGRLIVTVQRWNDPPIR